MPNHDASTHVVFMLQQCSGEFLHTQPPSTEPAYIPDPSQFFWTPSDYITESIRTNNEDPVNQDTHREDPCYHSDDHAHPDDQDNNHSNNHSDDTQYTEELNSDSYSYSNTVGIQFIYHMLVCGVV